MKPQRHPHQAHTYSARAPRAAAVAAASSIRFLAFSAFLVVSLGLSLAIILPR